MRNAALIASLVLAGAVPAASGLDIEDLSIKATVGDMPIRNKVKIRARLSDVDLATVGEHPMTLRFGDLIARVPAGGFRGRGKNGFSWRGTPLGVKKMSFNVKKATMKVVGGGVPLGDVEAPLALAMATAGGATCGELELTPTKTTKRKTLYAGTGPLGPCDDSIVSGATATVPEVRITGPTSQRGVATTSATVTITGEATDDVGVTAISWSSDRGGGGSQPPSTPWSIPDVALQPGDNRITVTATDADGNTGSDVIDVTYNDNGIVFDGMPIADPGSLPLGPRRLVAVTQAIVAHPDLDASSIEIAVVAENGDTTPVGPMADNGQFANGDLIQGDGRYSARVPVDGVEASLHRFRVSARTTTAPEFVAWSPILELSVTAPVTRDSLNAAIALADEVGAMLDGLLAGGATEDDLLDNLTDLAHVHEVSTIGLSSSGRSAWWVTADGLLGGAIAAASVAAASDAAPAATEPVRARRVRAAAPLVAEAVQVGTRQSLLLAPGATDAGAAEIADMLRAVDCPPFDVSSYAGAQAGAEHFQDLETFGIIMVAAGGDTLFGGIGEAYQSQWAWPSVGAQETIVTGTTLSHVNLGRWQQDLRLGRMAVMRGGTAAILPTFLSHHSNGLPGSLVLLAADNTAANGTLASAFLELGAATVLGFDGFVDAGFARDRSLELFTALLGGATVGDVFTPGQSDGGSPPATYALAGSDTTSINTEIIVNGSFEITSGTVASVTGFDVIGDAHVVESLGTWLPTHGRRMALVSTGLGLTTAVGNFDQTVCIPSLPPGATKATLSYDWNFFSEEFVEFCGSPFQDSFEVRFDDTVLQSSAIDDLCPVVVPDPIAFDRGDVYTTQWVSQAIDVTPFAGTTTTLEFGARDVGDSIYDSVILVDDVRIDFE